MKKVPFLSRKAIYVNAAWRCLFISVLTALSGQLYVSMWAVGFRISAAAILFPALLISMMYDFYLPYAGLVTAICVVALRTAIACYGGLGLLQGFLQEYPGGVFYVCYDILLCLLIVDRRTATPGQLFFAFWSCDFFSNIVNLILSNQLSVDIEGEIFVSLAALALARGFTAAVILYAAKSNRQFLVREEHEKRYRHLFLMTANLKTELYFLEKDSEDIEKIMSDAYRLYEKLEKIPHSEELTELALSIARNIHEVKKDNLRIIQGIEGEVQEAYDNESVLLSDLLNILEVSTRHALGRKKENIRLECFYQKDFSVKEHYCLLSILKNLVTNAAESIQSGSEKGNIRVNCRVQEEVLHIDVVDDGPGISKRAMPLLFRVGYSTKFHPDTGTINRGVGLPAVRFIVEQMGGTIDVESEPGKTTQFQVQLPLSRVMQGEDNENLHY